MKPGCLFHVLTLLVILLALFTLFGCAAGQPKIRPEIAADPVHQAVIRYFEMATAEHDR